MINIEKNLVWICVECVAGIYQMLRIYLTNVIEKHNFLFSSNKDYKQYFGYMDQNYWTLSKN